MSEIDDLNITITDLTSALKQSFAYNPVHMDSDANVSLINSGIMSISGHANTASSSLGEIQREVVRISMALTRPSAIFKPNLYKDGVHWVAEYRGDQGRRETALADIYVQAWCNMDKITCVEGCGDTPDLAMKDFDDKWLGSI